jgi:DNA-binding CsgD family transcriptional regulator
MSIVTAPSSRVQNGSTTSPLSFAQRSRSFHPDDGIGNDELREWTRVREAFREVEYHLLAALAELRAAIGAGEEATDFLAIEPAEVDALLPGSDSAPSEPWSASALLSTPSGAASTPSPDSFGLTAREREVLALLAQRQTNAEIAATMFISLHTASTHVKRVLAKLGVSSRRDAAALAARHGLA